MAIRPDSTAKKQIEPEDRGIRSAPLKPIRVVVRELTRPDGKKLKVEVPVYPPFKLEEPEDRSARGKPPAAPARPAQGAEVPEPAERCRKRRCAGGAGPRAGCFRSPGTEAVVMSSVPIRNPRWLPSSRKEQTAQASLDARREQRGRHDHPGDERDSATVGAHR